MGFIHSFGDARMPIWGVLAILANFLLGLLTRGGHRGLYLLSVSVLILFVVIYNRLSKPINRLQTEAAKTGGRLDNARELQASWDRSLMIRTPLLVASLLAQCLALLHFIASVSQDFSPRGVEGVFDSAEVTQLLSILTSIREHAAV